MPKLPREPFFYACNALHVSDRQRKKLTWGMVTRFGQTRTGLVRELLVMGGLSAIFWTLTLQTTLKYVVLTLRVDNNGEGDILPVTASCR